MRGHVRRAAFEIFVLVEPEMWEEPEQAGLKRVWAGEVGGISQAGTQRSLG